MTVPYERTQAVLRTRELHKRLTAGEVIAPETLQHHAKSLLKHYPTPTDIDLSARHFRGFGQR